MTGSGLLDGKVVVVTGSSAGLGRSIAEVFASRGADVVGVARREELGRAVAAGINDSGGRCHFIPADVGAIEDCRRVVAETVRHFGRIDVLVNNAATVGRSPVRPATELSEEDWDHVMDVNLKGLFFLCQFALPHMIELRRGTILNIASINAVQAIANVAAYNISKAGVVQLSRSLAVENVIHGINVNAVLLGTVQTDMQGVMTREMGLAVRGPDWEPGDTVGFGMEPERAARALSLLCADDASPINGAVIALDEGATAGLMASMLTYMVSGGQVAVGRGGG